MFLVDGSTLIHIRTKIRSPLSFSHFVSFLLCHFWIRSVLRTAIPFHRLQNIYTTYINVFMSIWMLSRWMCMLACSIRITCICICINETDRPSNREYGALYATMCLEHSTLLPLYSADRKNIACFARYSHQQTENL